MTPSWKRLSRMAGQSRPSLIFRGNCRSDNEQRLWALAHQSMAAGMGIRARGCWESHVAGYGAQSQRREP